jgi:hypothetical protein
MVASQPAPPDQPGQPPADTPPAAPPLTGYTVPGGWGAPPVPRAPGTVIAAAVVTYIRAALGILGSALLVVGGSLIAELGLFWVIVGVAVFVVSVLYVVAALLLQLRRNRVFLLWLTIIDIVLGVIGIVDTLARSATERATEGGGNLCSLILPIIVLVLLRHRNTVEWIEAHRTAPGQLPR